MTLLPTNVVHYFIQKIYWIYPQHNDKILQPDNTTITMEYDDAGRRTALIDPNLNRSESFFDGAGRVWKTIDPLGKETHYRYHPDGTLQKVTDRLGRTRTFDYDPNKRLSRETWLSQNGSVVKVINLDYDAAGNFRSGGDDAASFSMTHDSRNRLDTVTAQYLFSPNAPFTLDYAYDDPARRSSITDGDGVRVERTLDERGLLKHLVWSGGNIDPASVTFDYNSLGDMTGIHRYADAIFSTSAGRTDIAFDRALEDTGTTAKAYNANGRSELLSDLAKTEARGPLQIEPELPELMSPGNMPFERTTRVTHHDSASLITSNLDYGYDIAAQLTSEISNSEISNSTKTFGYDPTSQLTSVLSDLAPLRETFTYDDSGNRLSTVNGQQETENYTVQPSNRYSTAADWTLTYDDEGNVATKTHTTTSEAWSYTYDHRNRLTSATLVAPELPGEGGSVVEFQYDLFDRRISKSVTRNQEPETRNLFWYEGLEVWKETSPSGQTTHFLHGQNIDQHIARSADGQLQWFLTDRLGSVQAITDELGNVIQSYTYSAFGVRTPQNSELGIRNSYGFTGREHDESTGLTYYRARYMDPVLGRFTSEDPIKLLGADYNLTRITSNAITRYIDPYGLKGSATYLKIIKDFTSDLLSGGFGPALFAVATGYIKAFGNLSYAPIIANKHISGDACRGSILAIAMLTAKLHTATFALTVHKWASISLLKGGIYTAVALPIYFDGQISIYRDALEAAEGCPK